MGSQQADGMRNESDRRGLNHNVTLMYERIGMGVCVHARAHAHTWRLGALAQPNKV